MFDANSRGEVTFKPLVICHCANWWSLKEILKFTRSLGVYYTYSETKRMNDSWICYEIFVEFCFSEIGNYYKKNLALEALITMDTAPRHPPMITELKPNVRVHLFTTINYISSFYDHKLYLYTATRSRYDFNIQSLLL